MEVSYYPGCCMHGTAKGYDQSIQAVAEALAIQLREVEDWTCCGASSAHATDHELAVALPARNLTLADKAKLPVLVPCAACFNRFKSAQYELTHHAGVKAQVEASLGMKVEGEELPVLNPIDYFAQTVGLEAVAAKVTRRLAGLKAASYYGCLLVRPPEVCRTEDPENPTRMDRLVESLGAESTPWSFKTDCCGGSLTVARPEQVARLADRLMAMAKEAGANCLVTACPECMANLDMRATAGIPIFYFSELMAMAMGLPGADRWLKYHKIDPRPLLRQIGISV